MIRGEKIFTDRARATMVRKCIRAAKQQEKRAQFLRSVAAQLEAVSTAEQLEEIRLSLDVDVPIDLIPYCMDTRTRCAFCKKKEHGGAGGCVLSKPDMFACWRKECQRKLDRAIALDKKRYPDLWAAKRKAAAAYKKTGKKRSWHCRQTRRGRRGGP